MSGWFIAAGVVTLIAGAGMANQQNQAGKANEKISQNNERLAMDNARDANIQGARESQQAVWRQRAVRGAQMASFAAQGVDSAGGNASQLLDETALFGAADRKTIGVNAERAAWGFQGEATNHYNAGKQARWAGREGAKATILSSIGSAMGSFAGARGGGTSGNPSSATSSSSAYSAPRTTAYRYGPPG